MKSKMQYYGKEKRGDTTINDHGDALEWHECEGGFFTNGNFWDCECKNNYINPKNAKAVKNAPHLFKHTMFYCPVCGAEKKDRPDSRELEIQTYIYGNAQQERRL